jgi:hypothetical protein
MAGDVQGDEEGGLHGEDGGDLCPTRRGRLLVEIDVNSTHDRVWL